MSSSSRGVATAALFRPASPSGSTLCAGCHPARSSASAATLFTEARGKRLSVKWPRAVRRQQPEAHTSEDFLFPQGNVGERSARTWSPGFLDYLFLAFNTSTAFSPTDTAVLSRRAKVLMMVQALLSLLILAVLVSRAINALAAA
jgi:hypothetical protein